MYLDSAYIAKYYVNEADSPAVREVIRAAPYRCSSSWALVEVTCVFHRHVREGALTLQQGAELQNLFREHVEEGLWDLRALTTALLQKTAAMVRTASPSAMLRAGDAVHLATALDAGEPAIWTNDRQLLAAAALVGLVGKSA